MADSGADEHFVTADQLCVGMYVHLDVPWIDHPFTFSSFKIKTLEQIATIQALGIGRVRYAPHRSDVEPLPAMAPTDAPPTLPPPLAPADDPVYEAKRDRVRRLAERHERAKACELEFVSHSRTIKGFGQMMFSQPDVVREQATQLVSAMADSMLMDVEIAIQLMADKIGGEELYLHSLNVTTLAMMLAKEMKMPHELLRPLGLGAMFHDCGEVDIPDRVLRKTEALTRAEQSLIQQHCIYGVEIGRKLKLPQEALLVILQHHERVDGSGYPKRVGIAEQSPLARIVAIVNAYDELCNPHDPQRAMTPHEALSTMYAQQRNSFDTLAINTFIRCMGVYPPGTIVGLSNGALGVVISVNSARSLKPTVLVYDPSVPRDEAIIVDLELEGDVTVAKTFRPQLLPPAAVAYLSPRKRMAYYFDTESPRRR